MYIFGKHCLRSLQKVTMMLPLGNKFFSCARFYRHNNQVRYYGRSLWSGAMSSVKNSPDSIHRVRTSSLRRQFGSLLETQLVENTGSIARDILAAERTFLAWARTGLGFVGGGSALAAAYHRVAPSGHDDQEDHQAVQKHRQFMMNYILPASALLIFNGGFLLLFATRRFTHTVACLEKGMFPVATRQAVAAMGVTSASTVASLGFLWQAETVLDQ